jgi:hypothetical protein
MDDSQKLVVNTVVCWWLCSKVKVNRGIKPSSHSGLEPAPLTSEAAVAQYLHGT